MSISCGLGRRVGGTGVVAPSGKAWGQSAVGGVLSRCGGLGRMRRVQLAGAGRSGVLRWWCGWRGPGETLKALPSKD